MDERDFDEIRKVRRMLKLLVETPPELWPRLKKEAEAIVRRQQIKLVHPKTNLKGGAYGHKIRS